MKKSALLIGINYNGTSSQLQGCIPDVKLMKTMLMTKLGYTNVVCLTDNEIAPTKNNILTYLTNLINDSKNCSEIWFHYSGHGSFSKDTNNDEKDGYDEVIIPVDYNKNGVIVDDQLNNIFVNTKCTTYITMDCCHSGTIIDLFYTAKLNKNTISVAYESQSKTMTNPNQIYMLSGCSDDQTSAESYDAVLKLSTGALTTTFLKVLEENKYKITIENLIIQVNNKLRLNKYVQIPVFSSNKITKLSNYFICKN